MTAVEFDSTLGRLLAPWLAQRAPLFDQEIGDGLGVGPLLLIQGAQGLLNLLALADAWELRKAEQP